MTEKTCEKEFVMFAIDVNAVKNAAEITGSVCGSVVTGVILGAFVPASANPIMKGAYFVGSGLIGAVVGNACGKEAGKQVGMLCGEDEG